MDVALGVLAIEQEDAYKFNGVKKQFEVMHTLGAYDLRCLSPSSFVSCLESPVKCDCIATSN